MKMQLSTKTKTIISLVINLLIFVITTGVIISYVVTDSGIEIGIIRTKDEVFYFYTTDSNILAAIASMVIAVCDIRILRGKASVLPKAAVIFKFASTACLMITFLVCVFYLAPMYSFGFIFGGTFFHVHAGAPLMAFISLCFFEKSQRISIPAACWSFVPLAVYGVVYVIMVVLVGEQNGGWRDMYSFTKGGNVFVPIAIITLIDVAVVFGMRLLYNYRSKSIRKA